MVSKLLVTAAVGVVFLALFAGIGVSSSFLTKTATTTLFSTSTTTLAVFSPTTQFETVTNTLTNFLYSTIVQVSTQTNIETDTSTVVSTQNFYSSTTQTTTSTIISRTTLKPYPNNIVAVFSNLTNTMVYAVKYQSYTFSAEISKDTNVSLINVIPGSLITMSLAAPPGSLYCTQYASGSEELVVNGTIVGVESGLIGYCNGLYMNYTA